MEEYVQELLEKKGDPKGEAHQFLREAVLCSQERLGKAQSHSGLVTTQVHSELQIQDANTATHKDLTAQEGILSLYSLVRRLLAHPNQPSTLPLPRVQATTETIRLQSHAI